MYQKHVLGLRKLHWKITKNLKQKTEKTNLKSKSKTLYFFFFLSHFLNLPSLLLDRRVSRINQVDLGVGNMKQLWLSNNQDFFLFFFV
jgi:hypothetical protein